MRFQPGVSGNPSGRPKGSKNRTAEALRGRLKEFLESNIDKLQEDFDKLDSEKRLRMLDAFLKHILPPPVSLDKLTEEQLTELYEQLRLKFENNEEITAFANN